MDIKDFKFATVITGGIATGKSTVSTILKELGYEIIDADKIAHTLLDLKRYEIANIFGREYLKEDGIDRAKLGKLIFSDSTQRKKLESFLHPLIREELLNQAKALEKWKRIFFIDIPLFFEKSDIHANRVALVYAPKDLQIKRMRSRDNLSDQEIKERLKAQLPIEEKLKKSDIIIDNSGTIEELRVNVNNFLTQILH